VLTSVGFYQPCLVAAHIARVSKLPFMTRGNAASRVHLLPQTKPEMIYCNERVGLSDSQSGKHV